MGLEIAKIQNNVLKTIAEQSNQDGNEVISGRTEINLFEAAAKKAIDKKLVTEADFKSTMDLFEVEYPSENAILRNLAVESDEDKSEKLTGKEIDTYINKSKSAVEADLAIEEEIEQTTDGYYQKRGLWQKIGRGALISLGAIAGLGLAGVAVRGAFNSAHNYVKKGIISKFGPNFTGTYNTKWYSSQFKNGRHTFGRFADPIRYSVIFGGLALGTAAGGATAALMTKPGNR